MRIVAKKTLTAYAEKHPANTMAYEAAMGRIEELLPLVDDTRYDGRMWELDVLSELVSEYEDAHFSFPKSKQHTLPRVAAML